MQTFLPYDDFSRSASVLDRQRLGKQRVENLQIMKVLTGHTTGWANHPAVKMWSGYESALMEYQYAVCHEWTNVRGYNDTCLEKTLDLIKAEYRDAVLPDWIGDTAFHISHRSNLIRKRPDIYSSIWPDVPDDLEYIWPAKP